MSDAFQHPVTGEMLETLQDFLRALDALEEEMRPLYRLRRTLQTEKAVRFEAPLPKPRWRSPTQEKIARCPRCGGHLDH